MAEHGGNLSKMILIQTAWKRVFVFSTALTYNLGFLDTNKPVAELHTL